MDEAQYTNIAVHTHLFNSPLHEKRTLPDCQHRPCQCNYFSRVFSCSSAFNCFASDAVMPLNLLRQR